MTDKPDVAALVEWLQTWSPVTANGQRAHLAAAELTRLAAENRTYAEAHTFNSERFGEVLLERDAAKAEIARLDEAHGITQQGLWQTIEELKASCTRLRETKDTFFQNAEAWETKCNAAWRERDEANAEIARLKEKIALQEQGMDSVCVSLNEERAEIARLRELLKPFAESAAYYEVFGIYGGVPVRHLRDARAALKAKPEGDR